MQNSFDILDVCALKGGAAARYFCKLVFELTCYLVSDKQLFKRKYCSHLFIHFIFIHFHIVFKLATNTFSILNQHY